MPEAHIASRHQEPKILHYDWTFASLSKFRLSRGKLSTAAIYDYLPSLLPASSSAYKGAVWLFDFASLDCYLLLGFLTDR
jgi:hypothetical protein